jgi:hypothetical protein
MGGQADIPPVSALPFDKAGTKRRAAGGALRHAAGKLNVDVRADGRSPASSIRNLSTVKGTGSNPNLRLGRRSSAIVRRGEVLFTA